MPSREELKAAIKAAWLAPAGVTILDNVTDAVLALMQPDEAMVERQAVLAWLRSRRMSFGKPTRNAQAALNIAASDIEQGKHRVCLTAAMGEKAS